MTIQPCIQKRFVREFCGYYDELEKRLASLSHYISFEQSNGLVYSNELLTLLQLIGSEVDVCGKAIAEVSDECPDLDKCNIQKWGFYIQRVIPDMNCIQVQTPIENAYCPWAKFRTEQYVDAKNAIRFRYTKDSSPEGESPEWWRAYNSVKHRRKQLVKPEKSEYESANLKNVIHALGGLYVMEQCFLSQFDAAAIETVLPSSLFQLIDA